MPFKKPASPCAMPSVWPGTRCARSTPPSATCRTPDWPPSAARHWPLSMPDCGRSMQVGLPPWSHGSPTGARPWRRWPIQGHEPPPRSRSLWRKPTNWLVWLSNMLARSGDYASLCWRASAASIGAHVAVYNNGRGISGPVSPCCCRLCGHVWPTARGSGRHWVAQHGELWPGIDARTP